MNHNSSGGGLVKTLGGDRLGNGNKMKVHLHGYERSTHDLSYLWRSSMSAGTLVPFLTEVALPGDTFDIDLNAVVMTHPTLGPLFGSYKVQLDVFEAPIRIYQGALHNNKLGIGMNMANVLLPNITLTATEVPLEPTDIDNAQINPSALLAYLGIRGVGNTKSTPSQVRNFNAVPLLAYWDIYKNYYANKQEQRGAMIYTPNSAHTETVTDIKINGLSLFSNPIVTFGIGAPIEIDYSGVGPLGVWWIILETTNGNIPAPQLFDFTDPGSTTPVKGTARYGINVVTVTGWHYSTVPPLYGAELGVNFFQLGWIDDMREKILQQTTTPGVPFNVNTYVTPGDPYDLILTWTGGLSPYLGSQQGLGLKTYQSDLLNNWLFTDWIDGVDGINSITAVSTVSGSFTIDTLQLSKKVYDMLNRIAVSGGSYNDWMEAVWANERIQHAETPIYHGGLIKELIFQEVISNAQAGVNDVTQPLGTLAGRGTMAQKHKGGKIRISVDEPGYIMGIVSLTPRIDYSQGNRWDTHLENMNDFHMPALDQIGFQELITEQMAWWGTEWDTVGSTWKTYSAGKQPAWVNYMTNINRVLGNFAIQNNEMFMTLNRRYEYDGNNIADITTYIDPQKFNFIFADTALDSQNFWTQIAVNMEVRRKMSAKVMPNL